MSGRGLVSLQGTDTHSGNTKRITERMKENTYRKGKKRRIESLGGN